jgi:hypothetical protein
MENAHILAKLSSNMLDWKCVQNMGYIESLQFACKYVQLIKILEMCGKAVQKPGVQEKGLVILFLAKSVPKAQNHLFLSCSMIFRATFYCAKT